MRVRRIRIVGADADQEMAAAKRGGTKKFARCAAAVKVKVEL
jgi:hypothetical protein